MDKGSRELVLITSTSSGVKKWGFEADLNIHWTINVPRIPEAV